MRSERPCWLAILCLAAVTAQEPPAAPPRRLPDDATRPVDGPQDGEAAWQAVLAKVGHWQQQHPDLVRRIDIGKSVAGRPLFVLRIGSAADGAPEVYLGGGIHGSERSEADAMFAVDRLLELADTEAVAALLRSRVLWVQPVVNPDGVVARQRKNGNGVDLNRNFAARWQAGTDPERRDHPGSAAFSEPETRAVRDFLQDRPQLRAYLDLHRHSTMLIPAQRGADGTVNEVVLHAATALNAAMGGHWTGASLPHFPSMHGLSIDWVWGELGVVAFGVENPDVQERPPEQDPRWLGLLHLLERAERYPPGRAADAARHYPVLVTDRTRRDPAELARLVQPGKVLFADGFESEDSFASYFEIGGLPEGRVQIAREPALVHGGRGALQLTSTDNAGRSCGASPVLWLGDEGHDCVHLRYWIRYADDYDQGNLHHTGGAIAGVAGTDKWAGMGGAGLRPAGDDHFSTRVEGFCDWQRVPAPGFLHCYSYWMDMRRDRDGNYWGNMLGPAEPERLVPMRGRWYCVEQRVAVNTPGQADGELAVWIDGQLYLHYRGCRWRSSAAVRIKRVSLMVYVHEAQRDNRVCYDDLVVSTGYVGTAEPASAQRR